jgi:hypothetical protein
MENTNIIEAELVTNGSIKNYLLIFSFDEAGLAWHPDYQFSSTAQDALNRLSIFKDVKHFRVVMIPRGILEQNPTSTNQSSEEQKS